MWRLCFLIYVYSFVVNCEHLLLGDECTLKNSTRKGLCQAIFNCKDAIDLLKEKKWPQHCGDFLGVYPVVCCPKEKSEMKCLPHNLRKTVSLIVVGNGEEALAREFPHMAVLGYGVEDNIQWLCGGSLINEQFVLTAAHCIHSNDLGTVKWVRLGDLNLKETTDDAEPQNFAVSETFVHPNYKLSSHYHDIALIKLNSSARFTEYVKTACLHVENSIPEKLIVTGWGKTEILGETSDHLMKAIVYRVNHTICQKRYSSVSTRRLTNGIVDDYQVCAGDSVGRDTCPGDSGGPLQYLASENIPHYKIVGVTSFGKGCASPDSIGVYTRVSNYIRWIENIVWSE